MSNITLPSKINESVEFHAHGERLTVKKKGAGEYIAYLGDRPREHARWGDAREVREDIAHFLELGALPRGKQMFNNSMKRNAESSRQKIGEMGDVNPVEYGGGFIYDDERHGPSVEWFEGLESDPRVFESEELRSVDPFSPPDGYDADPNDVYVYKTLMAMTFPVYEVDLKKSGEEFLSFYDWIDWKSVASSVGGSPKRYTAEKLSTIKDRAAAIWDAAGDYGWYELDPSPMQLTLDDLIDRWDL